MFIIIIELLKLLSKHQNIIILIYWHKKDIEKSPLSIMIACGTSNSSVWQELFLGVLQSYLSPTRLWEVTSKVFELANICYKRQKEIFGVVGWKTVQKCPSSCAQGCHSPPPEFCLDGSVLQCTGPICCAAQHTFGELPKQHSLGLYPVMLCGRE